VLPGAALLLDPRPRPTEPFVWGWSFHPSVLIGVAVLGALYLHVPGARVSAWRTASFFAALLSIVLSLNGPMHELSDDYLFSVHMLQHLVLMLLMPPLLLLGLPDWLVRPLLRPRPVLAVARFLTRPLVAGLLFSVTLLLWHTVPFYDLMMRDHDIHVATHLLFMATAVIMWWPVLGATPELPRLPPGPQMLYLFLLSIPMQIAAALITMSDKVLYAWYAEGPRTWGLSALQDQQIGGLLMWVPGNLWIFGAIGIIFFRWAKEQELGARS
jgi:putative membrane protein